MCPVPPHDDANRLQRRGEYLAAGTAALSEFARTGIAYALEDVETYVFGIVAGGKPSRPKPLKAP